MKNDIEQFQHRFDELKSDHQSTRELLIEIRSDVKHISQRVDTLNDRVNKREDEIEALEERFATIETQIATFKGQVIMLKLLGGFIGLLLAGLEVYHLFIKT
ncbi:hypothetical protein F4X10_06615 [Candidatus Poribacteria bacterium]|nr:hypothetical protein [Candidatus Poribacteria bacterium]MYC75426.1 hypothetical protein [Candidatus Poribacteria bacterium]